MRKRAHKNLILEHVLFALIKSDDRFRAALKALGLEPKAVRKSLHRLVRGRYHSLKLASLDSLRLLASQKANRNKCKHRVLGIEHIVMDILRYEHVRRVFDHVDVPPFDLMFAYVHGVAPRAANADDEDLQHNEGKVDVFFSNDNYTTQEAVTSILRH